jgi:hypothetical protein
VAFAPTAPIELPGEPAAEPVAALLPSPPLRYEGIGLYTLHSTFLI